MTRTRQAMAGALVSYLHQGVVTLVGLWLTRFLLGHVGQERLGLWLIATAMLGYLSLLDLGIASLVSRETAFATGQSSEPQAVTDLVGESVRLVLWQTPLPLIAALGTWYALPAAWEQLKWPLAIVLITFVVTYPLRIPSAVLRGLQDLGALGIITSSAWLLGTIVTVVLVLRHFGLVALAIGWAVTQTVTAVAAVVRLATRFPGVLPSRIPSVSRERATRRYIQSGWISVGQLANVLLYGTDVLVLGKLLHPEAVVLYTCTGKLATVLGNQPRVLLEAAFPGLSQLRASGDRKALSRANVALTRLVLVASAGVLTIVLAVNSGFVTIWVGRQYDGGLVLTAVILVAMLLRHWSTALGYELFAYGYERMTALTVLADGLVTVAAAVFLVKNLGVVGAPLGSIVGAILVTIPAYLFALGRELRTGVRQLVMELVPVLSRTALPAFGAALIALTWGTHSVGLLVAATATSATLYLAGVGPLATKPPLDAYVLPRLTALRSALARWRQAP